MVNIDLPRKNNTPKDVFNPLTEDFLAEYRDDKNVQHIIKLLPMSSSSFPTWLADNIIKQLITAVQNDRHINPLDVIKSEEIRKEIEI